MGMEVNASGEISTDDLDKSSTRASLQNDNGEETMSSRLSIKDSSDIVQLADDNEDGLVVVGFFLPDDEGSVKNREEGSAYQVFRDSTLKNAKLPFGKSVDPELAKQFGAKTMDSMWMLKRNDKQSDVLEIRKCQFF